ncbi:peptidoglycan DD-metalloendopeptidase family protein [Cellulomonas sp. APG4]|uniref:M23 family metallopeptidase n=1 Tax=Cellulomonas sp. APG4 TaxID=1538656 RepID=UPI00137972F0|nr:M23 family metallopeptidase [Cellulomonas sp. APG4]NCT91570.1 peptidoglycan DD-metalloendopeptidase family protein [Cellulomonas sp. APG4]
MTRPSPRRRATALVATLLAALMAAGAVSPAVAGNLDDERRRAEQRAQNNQEALEDVHADLESTDAALLQTQAELEEVQAQIPVAEAELTAAEDRLAQLQIEAQLLADRLEVAQGEEATITEDISTDTARAEELRSAVGQVAREAYKGEMTTSSLAAVLDASTTEEFVEESALASTALRTQTQALRDLEQLTGVNRNRQARLTAVREEIDRLKTEADAKVVEAEQARQAAEDAKNALEDLQAQQQAKLVAIEDQKAAHLAKQAELEQQQEQLEADLKDVIARQEAARKKAEEEERRRQEEAAKNNGGSSGGGGGGSSAPAAGKLTNPTPLNPWVITSSYGYRIHPVYGYRKLHAGTDFRAYCGTAILAAAPGTVVWATGRGGYGNQVMLDHGYSAGKSLMTSYNHLSRFAVRAGQSVSRGQVVGYSGTTGTSTACHLHFEVYRNGATVNPMGYF